MQNTTSLFKALVVLDQRRTLRRVSVSELYRANLAVSRIPKWTPPSKIVSAQPQAPPIPPSFIVWDLRLDRNMAWRSLGLSRQELICEQRYLAPGYKEPLVLDNLQPAPSIIPPNRNPTLYERFTSTRAPAAFLQLRDKSFCER